MAIPVLPFNPPGPIVIQEREKQRRQNPWLTMLPTLAGQVVMSMVQNKLQGNLQKEQIKQEMLAKGYTWDEEKKTWVPPAIQTQDIGDSGDQIITQGGVMKEVYQSPTSRSKIRREELAEQLGLAHGYDIDKIGVQNKYDLERMGKQAELNLGNFMQQRGATKNDKGEWEFAQPTFGKDETTGIHWMQMGDNAVQVKPLGEATVKPIPGITGKSLVTFGDKAEIVSTGDGWLDGKGNPKTFTAPDGKTGVFTSANSVQLYDTAGKGELTADDAIKALEAHLKDIVAEGTVQTKVKSRLMASLANPKTRPVDALNEAIGSLESAEPSVDFSKYKNMGDVQKAFKAGVLTREQAKAVLQKLGYQ